MILGNTAGETRTLIGRGDPSIFDAHLGHAACRSSRRNSPFMGDLDRARGDRQLPALVSRLLAGRRVLRRDDRVAIVARPGHRSRSPRRAAGAAAHTWVFQFDWPTPIDGGRWGAHHGLDVPFIFDNVALVPEKVGTGADAARLAAQMSDDVHGLRAHRQSRYARACRPGRSTTSRGARRWCSTGPPGSSTIRAATNAACSRRCRMSSLARSATVAGRCAAGRHRIRDRDGRRSRPPRRRSNQILEAMKRATRFMVENVSTNGGYVWTYLPDLSRRWGELEARADA